MNSSKRFKYLRNNGTFSEVYSIDNQPPYPVTPSGTYPSMTVGNATNASKCDSISLKHVTTNLDVPLVKGTSFKVNNVGIDLDDYLIFNCETAIRQASEQSAFQVVCNRISVNGAPIIKFCGGGVTSLIGKMQFYVDFSFLGTDLTNPTIVLDNPIYVVFDSALTPYASVCSDEFRIKGIDVLKIN